MTERRVRLHLDQPLGAGQAVALSEGQANYLFAVMRLAVGASVQVFNGLDGEWRAEVAEAGKRRGVLVCRDLLRPQAAGPDLWFLVEKAVELGVSRLVPVTTRYLAGDRFRADKERAHAVEAAEQCEALAVPEVAELQPLERVLAGWNTARRLYWADEALAGQGTDWPGAPGPAAILIGPEGGFAPEEQARLRDLDHVTPVSLGPRILRAETAALAALTLWQARFGDWR
jgi:16S rRNA (uracil1498-N3)-methyltransferase